MKKVRTSELFESVPWYLENTFSSCEYPWQILPKIGELIKELTKGGLDGFREIREGVFVGDGVTIAHSAIINPPAIIGAGCEIRTGAYLRGNVIVGKGCVIGNSSELKNCILLDHVQVPHYNYVGDSILGNHSHMGASSICSNLKSDGRSVVIRADEDIETGLRKVGTFLGDYADIGSSCVLNPGTVIGKHTSVYPLCSLRGAFPEDSIVKSCERIVKRKTI